MTDSNAPPAPRLPQEMKFTDLEAMLGAFAADALQLDFEGVQEWARNVRIEMRDGEPIVRLALWTEADLMCKRCNCSGLGIGPGACKDPECPFECTPSETEPSQPLAGEAGEVASFLRSIARPGRVLPKDCDERLEKAAAMIEAQAREIGQTHDLKLIAEEMFKAKIATVESEREMVKKEALKEAK